MSASIFIDGEYGTTGLRIRALLETHPEIDLVPSDPLYRKDIGWRRDRLNSADLVVLCLPESVARDAVRLIENPDTKIIDASSAHRIAEGWVYGMPEYRPEQDTCIAAAKKVSNPGCYAVASIALLYPLVSAGVLPAEYPITINAVSGYSGGGTKMIERYEAPEDCDAFGPGFQVYALDLMHKHIREIQKYSCLSARPLFVPSVGNFRQGMIVQIPLPFQTLPGSPEPAHLHAALTAHYEKCPFVSVVSREETATITHLSPGSFDSANQLRLHVFGHSRTRQAVLIALLDNLGKGAATQAVQNANLMLGLPMDAGLDDLPKLEHTRI